MCGSLKWISTGATKWYAIVPFPKSADLDAVMSVVQHRSMYPRFIFIDPDPICDSHPCSSRTYPLRSL